MFNGQIEIEIRLKINDYNLYHHDNCYITAIIPRVYNNYYQECIILIKCIQ